MFQASAVAGAVVHHGELRLVGWGTGGYGWVRVGWWVGDSGVTGLVGWLAGRLAGW